MKFILLITVLFSSLIQAETLNGKFELKSSNIKYLVTYLIKKAEAESIAAKGKGQCTASNCEFIVAVPVKTFVSKDSNRDLNMLNTVKADKFPMAVVHLKTSSAIENGMIKADLEVEFVGVKKSYNQIPFKISITNTGFSVDGKFDLALTGHNLERPSLLGVSIDEAVPVTITGEWNKL